MVVRKTRPRPGDSDKQNLYRRYLLWCYKTTREALERVDRKFTQLDVDRFIHGELLKEPDLKEEPLAGRYRPGIEAFEKYMEEKERKAVAEKYQDAEAAEGSGQAAEYWSLCKRYQAVKRAVRKFCGSGAPAEFARLYEQEMTRRILEAREH
jgi:hypothetical protein